MRILAIPGSRMSWPVLGNTFVSPRRLSVPHGAWAETVGRGTSMTATGQVAEPSEQPVEKGLKAGALGLISTTVIATASVAPPYSIAATLVFVVTTVGLQSPAVTVLAFVPMLLTSIGYSELNKADPDCGTTFTWATRAFGPRSGFQRRRHRRERDERLGAARRHHLDRRDDGHLLRRHRALGRLPEGAALDRAHHAGRPVGDRAGQGRLGRRAARAHDPAPVLVQPVRHLLVQRVRERSHPHGLHLL